MLHCADGTYYTGITTDVDRRLHQHNQGIGAKYTRGRGPVRIVYTEKGLTKSEALKREHEIKQLSREEKSALLDTIR